jgi:5'-deoxynucleotidase YfbR-like HD superfamily hydrolase
MKDPLADGVVDLARMVYRLADIQRATRLPDGIRPESDSDHTLMLGVIACAYAAEVSPELDLGLIAQFALVHDLVESYAGDTNTFGGLDASRKADKEKREAEALTRIEAEFGSVFPWLLTTIHEYESLASPEARFVKVLDKIAPKITHLLNNLVVLRDEDAFNKHIESQEEVLRMTYGHDQEEALILYRAMAAKVTTAFRSAKSQASAQGTDVQEETKR